MTRDELIEKMAHAVVRSLLQQEEDGGMLAPYVDEREGFDSISIDGRVNIIAAMREAVSDIESAGLAIVPKEATAEQLTAHQNCCAREWRVELYGKMVEEGRVK